VYQLANVAVTSLATGYRGIPRLGLSHPLYSRLRMCPDAQARRTGRTWVFPGVTAAQTPRSEVPERSDLKLA